MRLLLFTSKEKFLLKKINILITTVILLLLVSSCDLLNPDETEVPTGVPTGDIYESDDTYDSTSNTLTPGDPVQDHTFHTVDDIDWYILDLSNTVQDRYIRIETSENLTATDTVLTVYNSEMIELQSNDTLNDGSYAVLYLRCSVPGIYYICASKPADALGDYSIEVTALDNPAADVYEEDNSKEYNTNRVIPEDDPQIHTIHSTDDEDWLICDFRGIAAGSVVQIETSSHSFDLDTEITLYDRDMEQIAYNDNRSTGSAFSLISFTMETMGDYYLKINGVEGCIGDYELTISMVNAIVQGPELNADQYEDDDTHDTTVNTIIPGSPIQFHTFHDWRDDDWFVLDLSDSSPSTRVEIRTSEWNNETDTILYLYDSDLNLITMQDDLPGTEIYAIIDYTFDTPGLYYVKVSQFSRHLRGDYSLYVYQLPLQPDSYENDDTAQTTENILEIGGFSQAHTFHGPDADSDWMILDCTELDAGTEIKIETYCLTQYMEDTDTELTLYNSDLIQIAYNDDKDGDDYCSRIDFVLENSGIYYLRVNEIYENVSDYLIDAVIQN